MARSNFVGADLDTLPLADGDYLVVKRELNVEEDRRIFARMVKTMIPGEKMELDPEQVGMTKILEYVVEWGGPGFQDADGRIVPFSPSSLKNIRSTKFKEITDAIDAHEAKQAAARDVEKNEKGDETKSGPISPSVA